MLGPKSTRIQEQSMVATPIVQRTLTQGKAHAHNKTIFGYYVEIC
jgi:hypothetical protein